MRGAAPVIPRATGWRPDPFAGGALPPNPRPPPRGPPSARADRSRRSSRRCRRTASAGGANIGTPRLSVIVRTIPRSRSLHATPPPSTTEPCPAVGERALGDLRQHRVGGRLDRVGEVGPRGSLGVQSASAAVSMPENATSIPCTEYGSVEELAALRRPPPRARAPGERPSETDPELVEKVADADVERLAQHPVATAAVGDHLGVPSAGVEEQGVVEPAQRLGRSRRARRSGSPGREGLMPGEGEHARHRRPARRHGPRPGP